MKHGLQSILLLASLTLLVSGCDFFRALAGRPTSDEIAAKRAVAVEMAEKAEMESIAAKVAEAVKQSAPDTLAAAPAAAPIEESPKPSKPAKILSLKYYIVVGTFSSEENARKLVSKAEAKGFPAAIFPFRGMAGVAVCGTDSREEINASLAKVRESGIFPKESWVYVNK